MNKENLLTVGRTLRNSPVGALVLSVTDMEPSGIIVNGYNHESCAEYNLAISEATMVNTGINRTKSSLEKFLNSIYISLDEGKYVLCSDLYALPKEKKLPTAEQIHDLLKNPDGLARGLSLYQHLVIGLGELCKVKPNGNNAVEYLGNWLITNNPIKPVIDEPIVTSDDNDDAPLPPARDLGLFDVSGFEFGCNVSIKSNGSWQSGTIVKDHGNGTYSVKNHNLSNILTVDKAFIRSINNDSKLQKGYIVSHILGFKGVVTCCNSDGTYEGWNMSTKGGERWKRGDLCYDDLGNSKFAKEKLSVGSACEGYHHCSSTWCSAIIKVIHDDDTCDILYDFGSMERTHQYLIRVQSSASVAHADVIRDFRVDDKVVVNYKGTGKPYPGKISAVKRDNTFDIIYDDGEIEPAVDAILIRLSVESTETWPLRTNDKIEGNYKGYGKWYTGKIVEVDSDNFVYSILYDDGETESNVPRTRIKQYEELVTVDDGTPISVADKVHGNYKGRGKWYPGRIKCIRDNGSIDIVYDDGEAETIVDRSLIRRSSRSSPLLVNDIIEGNYKGRGNWYPGKVSQDNGDGTYEIAYDDGESEARVPRDRVRRMG